MMEMPLTNRKLYNKEYYRKNKERIKKQQKRYEQENGTWIRCQIQLGMRGTGKLGNPKKIKQLCKIFGFSNDVSRAIAIDGKLLDDKLKLKEKLK